jgi:hypothetical protein
VAINYTKWPKIYQHFPFQGPPKYTQIWIFGHKINYLATLLGSSVMLFGWMISICAKLIPDNRNRGIFANCFGLYWHVRQN